MRKYNNLLRLVLTLLVLFPILMMAIPVQAPAQNINLNIVPPITKADSAPKYYATLVANNAPAGGFFFLNLTIPKGYTFNFPSTGSQVAKYTWHNQTNRSRVIIYIFSNNTNPGIETVDVIFSTDSGRTYRTRTDLPISNIVIGTSSLKFIKPSLGSEGYINLSLGGNAGPILSRQNAMVELSKDTLVSPSTPGSYTWLLEAKNSPSGAAYIANAVVRVR